MNRFAFSISLLFSGLAVAMTPQEFQKLYESKDKTAEVCYKLYQAYAEGDGVEADKSQARKWLLAAHDSGMAAAREEIANLPWRKKAKLKPTIKVAEVSDEEAIALGRELVEFMLDNGGRNRINMNSLPEEKPSKKLVAGVRKFIAQGADLNVCLTEQNDMVEATALYLACKMGDEGLMELLLNHGADPNAHGGMALKAFYLRTRPKVDTSQPLLGGGAISARDLKKMQKRDGKADKSQEKRARKLFNLLVKKGADVRMWNNVGWSPIYVAVNADSPLGVQMLVKAGADPDQKQNPNEVANHTLSAKRVSYLTGGFGVAEQETPLNTAAIYARDEVAAALLKAGADPTLANAQGVTPLQSAQQLKQQLDAKPAAERSSDLVKGTENMLKLLKAAKK
ncbi:MAG: hypothetical protein IJO38_09530 [Akkermansia sp.]|nr:hypothetical protein [Akkermansia sp.]